MKSSSRWLSLGLACGLAAAVAVAASAAPMGQTRTASIPPHADGKLGIAYTLTFWGIPFGATSFDMRYQKDAYETSSDFHTSGIVSAFWQANIQATSNGTHTEHTFQPAEYNSFYRRSEEKKERVKLTYASAVPTLFADPPYGVNRYPVTDEQMKEALDPMSAIAYVIAGAQADSKNPCGKVAPVFDGRRRYNIEFTYLKDEPANVAGIYTGNAHLCQIHYKQVAGFKPKILKEGAAFPPIYSWFIDVPAPNAPNGHYVVALRIWAGTTWGTVAVDLSKLQVDQSVPNG